MSAIKLDADVVVVGSGPVGMVLAMELKSRGVDVIVLERRPAEARPGDMSMARCNTNASRTMEIWRRLGVADKIRAAGLPDDYPTDVVWLTRANGHEVARLPLPSRVEAETDTTSVIANWPTAEPVHRASQLLVDPILLEHTQGFWGVDVRQGVAFTDFVDRDDHVEVGALPEGGEPYRIRCRYLVGCDGARSQIRKKIGAKLSGDDELYRSRTLLLRAPWMREHLTTPPAWMHNYVGPGQVGFMIAIDGVELWLLHLYLPAGEKDFDTLDTDKAVRSILSLPPERRYEIVNREDWIARRLLADRMRSGNVFVCGDASHIWPPFGGHGMNAGIADANNLACHIASVIQGWADPAVLDCFAAERKAVLDQVSRIAMDKVLAFKRRNAERTYPPHFDEDSEAGRLARAAEGRSLLQTHGPQYATKGLNFAFYYDESPIIAHDGEAPPTYTMGEYTPSTVPGCRAPHVFTKDGLSLYDLLGTGYTLLRFEPALDVSRLEAAAAARRLPLQVLDLERPANSPYRERLVLVRPDQQIAWRGDAPPDDPEWLVDLVRGALIGKRADGAQRKIAAQC